MIVLCEQCFPGRGDVEMLTIVPMSPCIGCGIMNSWPKPGPRCHAFRSDPRPEGARTVCAPSFDEWYFAKHGQTFEQQHERRGALFTDIHRALTRAVRDYVTDMVRASRDLQPPLS